jgi:hypothetical protein
MYFQTCLSFGQGGSDNKFQERSIDRIVSRMMPMCMVEYTRRLGVAWEWCLALAGLMNMAVGE